MRQSTATGTYQSSHTDTTGTWIKVPVFIVECTTGSGSIDQERKCVAFTCEVIGLIRAEAQHEHNFHT